MQVTQRYIYIYMRHDEEIHVSPCIASFPVSFSSEGRNEDRRGGTEGELPRLVFKLGYTLHADRTRVYTQQFKVECRQ